ncbi:ankyrin repeat-containing protein [Trifolium medium]|uniref:Ankyrin repeat-containing protein n=1 Tax=Trifolium medium TaxID=97028 RepID=A0A392M9S4_9FABA|nr:ankyrin repeat-containing protein [Trifolium medium]
MIQAAKHGNIEFIDAMKKAKPDLLWVVDKNKRGIFAHAILNPNLGPSSHHRRSGPALQMQREISWFKAVEAIVHPKYKETKNKENKKPSEIFTESHEELVKAGGKWTKETADAISLFTSSTSVLLFIGILTARYAENDFLTSLPLKLLLGLIALFFSVVSMMVAFCASLAMLLKGHQGVIITAMSFASIPIIVLVPSQLRLFIEIFKSTVLSN